MSLQRRLKALPWPSIGAVAAVVVVGITQPVLALVRENADYFPKEAWFHLSVLAWAGLLPFGLVLGAELALRRWAGERAWRVWRAALYTFLFASCLRQAQVYYPAPFERFIEKIPPRPVAAALLGLVFLLALRSRDLAHRYAASLGFLALLLLGSYAWGVGLGGPAWLHSPLARRSAAGEWKGDPVVVVVFDELSNDILLRDGRIDAELYPNFAALAAESAHFARVRTLHLWSKDAIPCMLSGRRDPSERSPKLFDYLPPGAGAHVREYFQPTYGWMRRHARPEHVFLLNNRRDEPLRSALGTGAALLDLLQETPFSRSPFGFRPSRRLMPPLLRLGDLRRPASADAREFLDDLRGESLRNRITFWHAPLPHFPFVHEPDGTLHTHPAHEFLGPASPNPRPPPPGYSHEAALENYRKQVRFTDRVLGQIVERLKREGVYERTTLAVTSDHGLRSWGALPPADWPRRIEGSVARVPLLLRGPRVKPGLIDDEITHLDFLPTLLDAIGLPYDPAEFEGVSAFASSRPRRTPELWDGGGGAYAYDAAADVWVRAR